MSTNDELIAEARRLEGDYGDNYEVMCHMSDLADALEQVTAERDELIRQRDEVDAEVSKALQDELDRVAEHRGRLIEERNALAAVVEHVRGILGPNENGRISINEEKIWLAVHSAPSVALDRVKWQALREAAQVLRDADDGFRFCEDYGYRATRINATEDYLNARADRIKKGESNDQ